MIVYFERFTGMKPGELVARIVALVAIGAMYGFAMAGAIGWP